MHVSSNLNGKKKKKSSGMMTHKPGNKIETERSNEEIVGGAYT